MTSALVLAIDQGTSATKCALIDHAGGFVARASVPIGESHPQPGWVEQDGHEIWRSVQRAVATCLEGIDPARVIAIGLSSQRESLLMWDGSTGDALSPVISWQDQRGAALCDALRSPDNERLVQMRSGLPLDPMFSAVKAQWLLDRYDPDRRRASRGLCLGTIDAWLLGRFSGEAVTEAGNASRTQLLDLRTLDWDDELLDLFRVPRACLPRVVASTGPFPAARDLPPLRDGTPVHAVMGDSHAALFGHGATSPGQVKATYGTGSSVMGLVARPDGLQAGLCLTIGWMIEGRPAYAAEGNIRSAGSALRWMAGILGLDVPALVELGLRADSDGVVLVPGFGGLGAPWWDRDAVGLLSNLTLGSPRAALARAALDSVVFQVGDVVEAIARSVGAVDEIFVDGGPTRTDGLMQMQADQLGRVVLRAAEPELSALGVAHLAGLSAGLWSHAQLASLPRPRDRFVGRMTDAECRRRRRHWHQAVARATMRPAGEHAP